MSSLYLTLAVNSVAMGGLLFLLSAGFSLIFGLMRIPNLMHGSFFMLGAYLGFSMIERGMWFWAATIAAGLAMAVLGGIIERALLRRLAGQTLPQVLLRPLQTIKARLAIPPSFSWPQAKRSWEHVSLFSQDREEEMVLYSEG